MRVMDNGYCRGTTRSATTVKQWLCNCSDCLSRVWLTRNLARLIIQRYAIPFSRTRFTTKLGLHCAYASQDSRALFEPTGRTYMFISKGYTAVSHASGGILCMVGASPLSFARWFKKHSDLDRPRVGSQMQTCSSFQVTSLQCLW